MLCTRLFHPLFALMVTGFSGAVAQEHVLLRVTFPGLVVGKEAALFIDGEGFKVRLPAEGYFELVRNRAPTGDMFTRMEVRQATTSGLATQWDGKAELNGSGHVEWIVEGSGNSRWSQWPAVTATSGGKVLEVLIAGRMAGHTPVTHGIPAGTPQEVLWRETDGTTVCVHDITLPADSTRALVCDPATGKVSVPPKASRGSEMEWSGRDQRGAVRRPLAPGTATSAHAVPEHRAPGMRGTGGAP